MDDIFITIKESLIRLLKALDPLVDVFAEEIAKTEAEEQELPMQSYYFVEIIPTGNKTVDAVFSDVGVLIDISFYDQSEENAVYLKKASAIDKQLRPVFRFADRAITVPETTSKIVDHVLHYTFRFIVRVGVGEKTENEFMDELEIRRGE